MASERQADGEDDETDYGGEPSVPLEESGDRMARIWAVAWSVRAARRTWAEIVRNVQAGQPRPVGKPVMTPAIVPTIRLTRLMHSEDGVFGTLTGLGLALKTCEDDWQDNASGISCIPAGTYTLKRTIYHKHGFPTYEVTGVPGRSRILIHPGNTEEDTAGCVLLGLAHGWVKIPLDEDTGKRNVRKYGVLHSRDAFTEFMAAMQGIDEAPFLVEWAPGQDPTIQHGALAA